MAAPPVSAPVPGSSSSQSQVGIVAMVSGIVQLKSTQVGRDVKSGQPVYLGDEVTTDEKGQLQILLLDETIFTVGPNSSLTIDEFVYDPASQSGKVHATVSKGVFRFVTGKIGQKRPQDVQVDLPAGTIGIRGTMVAGQVQGKRSLVILLGPGEKNNTPHRQGRILLSNGVDGKAKEVLINRAGFGSIIEGDNSAPSGPFQVPAATLNQISQSLASSPENSDGDDSGSGDGNEGGASPTEQAGQDTAQAQVSVQSLNTVGAFSQDLTSESNQAAQENAEEAAEDIFSLIDGVTSFDQMNAVPSGKFNYHEMDVPLYDSMDNLVGDYNISVEVDFAARTVGGGDSTISGQISSNPSFSFSLGAEPFGSGPSPAVYFFDNTNSTPCGGSCDLDAALVFLNAGGVAAESMLHSVSVVDSPGAEGEGASIAGREAAI